MLESRELPLGVDLDGTLIRADMLYESVMLLLKQQPWLLLMLPLWLLRGKAYMKRRICERVVIDFDSIPLNEEFCDYLRQQKAQGRRLGLFSASDQHIVQAMARRFGIFDIARGSDGQTNLAGARKLASIVDTFAPEFVYAGNSSADFEVWRGARAAIVVGQPHKLRGKVQQLTRIEREFSMHSAGSKVWLKALRIHQWVKNLLIFVPLLLAAPLARPHTIPLFIFGFLALSVLASGTYLLNDLLDLESDRKHRTKRFRPLAAGIISIRGGILAAVGCGLVAVALLALMPLSFALAAGVYFVVTVAYSLALKKAPILDTLSLGFLFTLRIYAGTLLLGGPTPYWLFAFSMFFFTSLALVKRFTEIDAVAKDAAELVSGRGYHSADLPLVRTVGVGLAISAIVVFLIYLGDQHFNRAVFRAPEWLALTCAAVAYWLLRIWLLAGRGQMHDDPILFALRDRVSLGIGLVVLLSLACAW